MEKLTSNITAAVVPNCGHIVQAEQPQLMYNKIAEFLTQVD